MTTRRHVILGLSALPLAASPLLPAHAAQEQAATDAPARFIGDFAIGAADAPVTVYEYISYTCGYCAAFHQNVWPEIKAGYVDTGKARFVIRGFYRNTVDLDVALLSRCGGEAGFYQMAGAYLDSHSVWTRASDITDAIKQIAKRNGMPTDAIDSCLADQDFKLALVTSFRENAATHQVESTPTFVVNDTVHRGLIDFESLAQLIDDAIS